MHSKNLICPDVQIRHSDNNFVCDTVVSNSVSDGSGSSSLMVADAVVRDFNNDYDLNAITEQYIQWVQQDEYFVLEKYLKYGGVSDFQNYVAVKCSKRGNDVYLKRLEKTLKNKFGGVHSQVSVDINSEIKKTNALYFTLSYDTKLKSRWDAWLDISKELNLFCSNVRKQFGTNVKLRSWETYENGYPHVHILIVFKDKSFTIKQHFYIKAGVKRMKWIVVSNSLKYNRRKFSNDKKDKKIMSDKDIFAGFWHSFVDVQGVVDLDEGIKNVVWYVMKNNKTDKDYHNINEWPKKDLLTTVACWFFRKRSFSISGKFGDLMQGYCIIQTSKYGNSKNPVVSYEMLGVVAGDKCKIDSAVWCKVIKNVQDWFVDIRSRKISSGLPDVEDNLFDGSDLDWDKSQGLYKKGCVVNEEK